ncbi:MAG: hypothetical protein D6731_01595 [Planctomycetota bacterium]|nr:MAG: hypothetical protein D6731_01595 [Planctomycetota bacterium]
MAFELDPRLERYHELVRAVARREEVPAAELEEALRAAQKSREDFERDLALARERRRLLKESNELLELELRCAIAAEGYRMIREAAARARAEAAAREERARAAFRQLQGRLRGARRAEQRLCELLPPHLVERLEERRRRLEECRRRLAEARRAGRSVEHLEADLEQAEQAWRAARDAIA